MNKTSNKEPKVGIEVIRITTVENYIATIKATVVAADKKIRKSNRNTTLAKKSKSILHLHFTILGEVNLK